MEVWWRYNNDKKYLQCYENNVEYVVNIGAKCEVVPITNKHNSLIFFSTATPV